MAYIVGQLCQLFFFLNLWPRGQERTTIVYAPTTETFLRNDTSGFPPMKIQGKKIDRIPGIPFVCYFTNDVVFWCNLAVFFKKKRRNNFEFFKKTKQDNSTRYTKPSLCPKGNTQVCIGFFACWLKGLYRINVLRNIFLFLSLTFN